MMKGNIFRVFTKPYKLNPNPLTTCSSSRYVFYKMSERISPRSEIGVHLTPGKTKSYDSVDLSPGWIE